MIMGKNSNLWHKHFTKQICPIEHGLGHIAAGYVDKRINPAAICKRNNIFAKGDLNLMPNFRH